MAWCQYWLSKSSLMGVHCDFQNITKLRIHRSLPNARYYPYENRFGTHRESLSRSRYTSNEREDEQNHLDMKNSSLGNVFHITGLFGMGWGGVRVRGGVIVSSTHISYFRCCKAKCAKEAVEQTAVLLIVCYAVTSMWHHCNVLNPNRNSWTRTIHE